MSSTNFSIDYEALADLISLRQDNPDADLSREGEVLVSILNAAYVGTSVNAIVTLIRDAYVFTEFSDGGEQ